jgi:hypothetical protein
MYIIVPSCNIVAGALPLRVWRAQCGLAALHVYKNRVLPLCPLHYYTLSHILSLRPHRTPTLGAPLPSWPRVLMAR